MIFSTPCFAADETLTITTYYPSPYGSYNNLTVANKLGIGTTSPGVALDMAQSTALRVGNAYLSSGGVYAHLATYEWYDGTSWHNPTSTAGLMFQLNGATNVNIYYHDGAQAHTLWATCASTAGWTAGSSKTYKQNIKTLTDSDYASLRKQFQSIPMFSYNRKDAPKEQEVGFISEYAPDLVVSGSDKTQITLLKAIGYLAAIGKGQENAIEEQQSQIDALKQEISQLKTKLNSRRGQ